ncbi:hypothetical protein JSE7799_03226 [Jannaschia seosinensis]|uniref:Uncharacterized protein n=1 Tax=Jannaschia seosinensis TaxID=313367 RepID=A0A0M7BFD0_9RHOB|nr:hypothetical protein JSE7799_03226 [Jannaschia seosinensis]
MATNRYRRRLLCHHLGQVFHVYVKVARLVGLEGVMRRLRLFWLQRSQVARSMPTQTVVEPGARVVRVQELAHHGEQVVERQQQGRAQGHGDSLLRRRQRRLKTVWRVASVLGAVPVPPLPDRLLGDAVALRHHPRRLGAGLDRSPDLRCRRPLLVEKDQHARPSSQSSRRIDLAMKSAERRGSTRSSGTEHLRPPSLTVRRTAEEACTH